VGLVGFGANFCYPLNELYMGTFFFNGDSLVGLTCFSTALPLALKTDYGLGNAFVEVVPTVGSDLVLSEFAFVKE
jgi:hypothetical protein